MEDENINVNDADAIFIPSNIEGDRTNYTEYKAAWIRSIPENCVLVRKNILTGRLKVSEPKRYRFGKNKGEIKNGGWRISNRLLTRSIYVPIIDRTIDYPAAEYLTKDNINANVDIVLKVKISDPIKYLKYGKYQLANLNTLTQNLLRSYIRRHDYNQLSSGRVGLDDFQTTRDDKGHILDRDAYKDFEEKYGISVSSIQLKSIKLPPELQKFYDDKREEEMKREAQKIRLEANEEAAKAEAVRMQIKAEAEAKRTATKIDALKRAGVSEQRINDELGTFLAADNPNASIIVGSGASSRSSEIAAGIAAGQRAAHQASQRPNPSIDRIKTLKELIQLAIDNHIIDDYALDTYRNFLNALSNNQKLIDAINNFPEQQFNQLAGSVLTGELGRQVGSQENSNGRTRR